MLNSVPPTFRRELLFAVAGSAGYAPRPGERSRCECVAVTSWCVPDGLRFHDNREPRDYNRLRSPGADEGPPIGSTTTRGLRAARPITDPVLFSET